MPKRQKLSRNENVLILTEAFRCFKDSFLNVFLMAFMMKVSLTGDPSAFIIFTIVRYGCAGLLSLLLLRFFVKHPLLAWRASSIVVLLEILMVIFFSSWPGFIYVTALLSALQSALYWRPKMYFETNEIKDSERVRYHAQSRIVVEGVRVVVPLAIGLLIDSSSYQQAAVVIFIVSLLQLLLSYFFRPENTAQKLVAHRNDTAKTSETQSELTRLGALRQIFARPSLRRYLYLQLTLGFIANSCYSITATYALNRFIENDSLRGLAVSAASLAAIIALTLFSKLSGHLNAQRASLVAMAPGIILVPLIALSYPSDPVYGFLFYVFAQVAIFALIDAAVGRTRAQDILSRHVASPADHLALEVVGNVALEIARVAALTLTLLGFYVAGYQGMLLVTVACSFAIFPFIVLAIPSSSCQSLSS